MNRAEPRWKSEAEYAAALAKFAPEGGGPFRYDEEAMAALQADIDAAADEGLAELLERLRDGGPHSEESLRRMGLIPVKVQWLRDAGSQRIG